MPAACRQYTAYESVLILAYPWIARLRKAVVFKLTAAGLLAFCLAACASRPGGEALIAAEPSHIAGAKTVTIYVATTRQRDLNTEGQYLNRGSEQLSFLEFTVSIPPNHVPGQIEWRGSPVDHRQSFAVVRSRPLSRSEFASRTGPTTDSAGAAVFVHGFNVTFQEGIFRAAQLAADADIKGKAVLFSWPSAGSVGAYLADKDAVTASRDGLAEVLDVVARNRSKQDVMLLAHSMGSWLTVEALRQLRLQGRHSVLDRLEVVLAAPDIDIEVFRSQLAVIGRMKSPITVLVSKDDVALRVSSKIAMSRERAGSIDVADPLVADAARRYHVRVVDISSLSSDDDFNHGRFVTLDAHLKASSDARAGLKGAGAFALNSVGAAISSPFAIAGKILEGR